MVEHRHATRRIFLLFSILAAFFQSISAFRFTGPPTDEPLDLSRPITITWERGNVTRLDTFVLYLSGGDGHNYTLGDRLSFRIGVYDIDDGILEWDPVPRVTSNQNNETEGRRKEPMHKFSSGKMYRFIASLHYGSRERDDIRIGNYTVINWESGSGRRVIPPLLALFGMLPVVYYCL